MKTLVKMALLVAVVVSMAGCAGNRNAVVKAGESTRQDVFKEVSDSAALPGKALLKIDFPLKNFKARFVETYVKHSDPPYTVIVNIDGQSVVLVNEPVLEDLPGDFKENPEVGTGWKYNFKKTLALQPGKHHVSVALPVSDVIIEKEVDLKEGENVLQLSPKYIASISRYPNFPRFSHGIRSIATKLNNKEI